MQKWKKCPFLGAKKHLFEPNCSLFAICHLFATLQSIDYQCVLQQWQIWQINQENFSSKKAAAFTVGKARSTTTAKRKTGCGRNNGNYDNLNSRMSPASMS